MNSQPILRDTRQERAPQDEVGDTFYETLTMRNRLLLRHQRVHVFDRLDKIFLEFLHHGSC